MGGQEPVQIRLSAASPGGLAGVALRIGLHMVPLDLLVEQGAVDQVGDMVDVVMMAVS